MMTTQGFNYKKTFGQQHSATIENIVRLVNCLLLFLISRSKSGSLDNVALSGLGIFKGSSRIISKTGDVTTHAFNGKRRRRQYLSVIQMQRFPARNVDARWIQIHSGDGWQIFVRTTRMQIWVSVMTKRMAVRVEARMREAGMRKNLTV